MRQIRHLTTLSAQNWVLIYKDFTAAQAEEDSDNLPAVAEIVDKKVDAAVDGEEEVTNQE